MKGKRYPIEQKICILREADRSGKTIMYVCREQQISEQTFHRWKKEFGRMEGDQAMQAKELQKENARLKRRHPRRDLSAKAFRFWETPCLSGSCAWSVNHRERHFLD